MLPVETGALAPTQVSRLHVTLAQTAKLCVVIGLALCFPTEVRAEVVSGQVYDPDGVLLTNQTFRVLGEQDTVVATFTTDGSGYFSVYLQPGAYRVRRQGSDDSEGEIKGHPQPARQDVRLTRRQSRVPS
jgi:Carboxypeptidase regulatory-like domain